MSKTGTSHHSAEHELPEVGKISSQAFRRVILPRLGAPHDSVLVGPQHGVDAAIVDLGHDQVMAITTDPFFIVPDYGWERASWFAVQIVASDGATSGLSPAYLSVDLNLPRSMSDEQLGAMWEGVHRVCCDLGIAVVTGHTGRYDNSDYPMLGGATVIALGHKDAYVTPAMARPGDAVIVTKGPAIEATALFGITFPQLISTALGPDIAGAAQDLFWQMTVVKDAMTAVEVGVRDGGVTAMHDATERGVLGGLAEIGEASDVGMMVDLDALPLRPEVQAICEYFSIDPFAASSEGTLLLTCRPQYAPEVCERLAEAGVEAFDIGEITPAAAGMRAVLGGVERRLEAPATDPFWPAYRAVLEARG